MQRNEWNQKIYIQAILVAGVLRGRGERKDGSRKYVLSKILKCDIEKKQHPKNPQFLVLNINVW